MAARVTEEEVLLIMDSALTEEAVESYVISANVFITNTLGSAGLSEALLKEIERWTAAHMIALSKERQSKEESAGTAAIKYAGQWGKGMEQTSYGQMAITLDSTGTLANLAKGKGQAYTYAVTSFE